MSRQRRHSRILIVGAGPTGLTAAVELARRGVLVDVVEKHPRASELSRAVGLLPSSMRIFERSGVACAIRSEAVEYRAAVFHDEATPIARLDLVGGLDANERLLGLAQDRTESHLRAAFEALGGRVHYATQLTALVPDEAMVRVTLNGIEDRYEHVIGADGVRSTVRAALGLRFQGHDLAGEWSIADVDCRRWRAPEEFHAYLRAHGRVVVVAPMASTRFRLVSNTPDALVTLPVPMDVVDLRRRASFRISVRQVERYRVGRVYLAGDAAHCHSPVGGRGMNLGIADAADLARRIVDGELDGYHAARHAAGRETITASERGRRVVTSTSGVVRALLRAALRTIDALPPIERRVTRSLLSL